MLASEILKRLRRNCSPNLEWKVHEDQQDKGTMKGQNNK